MSSTVMNLLCKGAIGFRHETIHPFWAESNDGLKPVIEPSDGWRPQQVSLFSPQRIILAKGSTNTLAREKLVSRICDVYPGAETIKQIETPHSLVEIEGASLLDRHYLGKKTLVFGELGSAVRLSNEKGNTCPNYWHFSPYGFCPYGCRYCYLAGTTGVKFSPSVKIYVNIVEMLQKIDKIAGRLERPTAFYLGKLQDGLALDLLTGYSRIMIPFFARNKYARLTLLTKSADIENLIGLDHAGHTILSWSLNPRRICEEYESNTPSLENRLRAMERCAADGYPVRAVVMPILPIPRWEGIYAEFMEELLQRISLDRITLGGICIYKTAYILMKNKLPESNAIVNNIIADKSESRDGRMRYSREARAKIYCHLIQEARRWQPKIQIALCLEEDLLWTQTGLAANKGKCNCVL